MKNYVEVNIDKLNLGEKISAFNLLSFNCVKFDLAKLSQLPKTVGNIIKLNKESDSVTLLCESTLHNAKDVTFKTLRGNKIKLVDLKEDEPFFIKDSNRKVSEESYVIFESYDKEKDLLHYKFFKKLSIQNSKFVVEY